MLLVLADVGLEVVALPSNRRFWGRGGCFLMHTGAATAYGELPCRHAATTRPQGRTNADVVKPTGGGGRWICRCISVVVLEAKEVIRRCSSVVVVEAKNVIRRCISVVVVGAKNVICRCSSVVVVDAKKVGAPLLLDPELILDLRVVWW